RLPIFLVALGLAGCATAPVATIHSPQPRADWSAVDVALGRAGSSLPGNVHKFAFPRSDLDVRIGDVHLKPALALGSWAAFMDMGGGNAMTMGDLVLTENEVDDVVTALQIGGIEQSALHNHVLGESPRVMYLHFSGHGDAVMLARTLRDALEHTKTPLQPQAGNATTPDVPVAELDRILRLTAKPNGGVLQYGAPRAERIVEQGMEIPPAAGVATAINFQPTGNGRAAITGDFVLLANEVNPVIRELRAGGIAVTALHSHMLDETPRLFFMHFWANDDPVKLATTLRRALDLLR